MKYIKTASVAALLGLAIGGYAIVQNLHGARMDRKNAAAMVGHLCQVFGEFALFDVNKDGQLDTAEMESLAKAIETGSLTLPAHTPPKGVFPTEEQRLNHMVEMYARFAVYDANHDGDLDSTEQVDVRGALENGELGFPHGNVSGGHHQPHGLHKSLHPR
jgi:hypothetical protein